MIYLSMSLIRDFLDCPKRLSFRVGGSGVQHPTKEMLEGTAVHEVIEKHWDSKDNALKLLKNLSEASELRLDEKKMTKCVDNFFLLYSGQLSKTDEIERLFKVPYNKEITLVGKFDRVHNNVLYDWKTGDRPPEDLNRDIQFMLYHIAYKRLYKREPSAMVYASLSTKKNYLFKPDKALIEELEQVTIPYVFSELKKRDHPRLGLYKYGVCKRCPFSSQCLEGDV